MEEKKPVSLPENAQRELKPGEKYQPILDPAKRYAEVTPYSVCIGILMVVLFSAAAAYLGLKVGQVFEGIITAVTAFGLFVELRGVFVEGLVHVTSLRNDYYQFDPVGHRLHGERSGQVYRLGDRLTVRVVRADLDERKIDFEPVENERREHGQRNRYLRRRRTE